MEEPKFKVEMEVYSPNAEVLDRLKNNFTYHKPLRQTQSDRYELIRAKALEYAEILVYRCPHSRELSLALTKLEEVMFWANASIARNEKENYSAEV